MNKRGGLGCIPSWYESLKKRAQAFGIDFREYALQYGDYYRAREPVIGEIRVRVQALSHDYESWRRERSQARKTNKDEEREEVFLRT